MEEKKISSEVGKGETVGNASNGDTRAGAGLTEMFSQANEGKHSITSSSFGAKGAYYSVGEKEPKEVGNLSGWGRFKRGFGDAGKTIHRYPSTAIVPLIIFCILTGLGIFGTIMGAQSVVDNDKDLAESTAAVVGASFVQQVEKSFAPLTGLRAHILHQPKYYDFKPIFPSYSESLLVDLPPGTIAELQCSPMGVVESTYPNNPGHNDIDIFNTTRLRPGAITTMKLDKLVLSGPLELVVNEESNVAPTFAGIARLPIFMHNVSDPNEAWGYEMVWPTDCGPADSLGGCYELAWQPKNRNTKFWGFVTAIISFEALTKGSDSRLSGLTSNGYNYLLTRPATPGDVNALPPGATEYEIASSDDHPSDSVIVKLNVSNNIWTLYVSQDGWQPGWVAPVIVAVIIMSAIISALVMFAMISKKQQDCLLEDVLTANTNLAETTRKLEEEKTRTDALLVRQFNLIECFGREAGKGGTGDIGVSIDGSTIDRIEAVRRQLNQDNIKSLADAENIQTLDLLGQGMFGKVYKGLWRGTEVAVKTMVLPANMSGAERREKMAVMEAAISSSLAHPNIVQTYTYNIKPVYEAKDSALSIANTVKGECSIAPGSKGGFAGADGTGFTGASTGVVHGYEIKMVLEYCDKGALRDALDCGALFDADGLNYRGILDLMADIAKAMLHLHSSQVLHGDLKASNVMLKSSGESRRVLAKVADFGLSVRMDAMETHLSNVFQGTLTHMAPEIMLAGHLSKAADVYAFGITMWEVFTSSYAYKGTPRALLGHQVTREGVRPKFPLACPFAYRHLAERCWAPRAGDRPDFETVLTEIMTMRSELEGPTGPIIVDMDKQREKAAADEAAKAEAQAGGAGNTIHSQDAFAAGVVVGSLSGSGNDYSGIVVNGGMLCAKYMNQELPTVLEDGGGDEGVEDGPDKV